jgi:hypothetical protein
LPKLEGMSAPRDRQSNDTSLDLREESGEYPSATESAGPASCSTPRWPAQRERTQCAVIDERQRVRLIGDLSKLLHDPCVPETAKTAGLTLIGWLARRQPGEEAHGYGVDEATQQRARPRRVR